MRISEDETPPVVTEMSIFQKLLEPLSPEVFEASIRGTSAWFQPGRDDRFESLLSWRSLNQLIRDQRPSSPRFRVMKSGRPVPEAAYHRTVNTGRGPLRTIDPARLLAQARGGATIVWDAIDQAHEPIRAAKQDVERSMRAFAFVNMYASWGTVGGLDDHWDDHDVFVMQLVGHKKWQVEPPTLKWPMADDFGLESPPSSFTHEWNMAPGAVLYLPRGWWHRVTPLDEPSLHLTIGVLRPTNADFLHWLVDQATASEVVRQDFPVSDDDDAARTAHADALRSIMQDWISPSMVEAFNRFQDRTHYLDPRPTLQAAGEVDPASWDPDSEAVLLSTRADLHLRENAVVLTLAGQEWRAPSDAEPVLQALTHGNPVTIGALRQHVSDSMLSELVTAGIIAIT